MVPISLRRPAVFAFLIFSPGFCLFAEGVSAPSAQSLYDQALHDYSVGLYSDALALFIQVQDRAGRYRDTQTQIARCAKALSAQRDGAAMSVAVERARGMLALRESALGDLRKQAGARVMVEDEVTSIQCPGEFFKDDLPWDALNAWIATVPGAWVTLYTTVGDADDSHAALLLAERLVREGGFPMDRIALRSDPQIGAGITLRVSPRKLAMGATDTAVPGILVRADRAEFRTGETADLLFDILVLNSGNSRRWNLDIVDDHAAVVRRFEGPPTAMSHVRWDGRDVNGQWVSPGTYLARLSVSGWTGDPLTDKTGFTVVQEESPPKPHTTVPALPSVPVRRQHRFVIRFQENTVEPLERERDAASRVAYLLTINPGKNVVVAGSVGSGEKNPAVRASQRADWVRRELVRLGIPLERVRIDAAPSDDGAAALVLFED